MKLIGILTGDFEVNKWAKLIFTEPLSTRPGCFGENAIISRARYDYVFSEILPVAGLFLGQEVEVSYDRFGKIQSVRLLDSDSAR